MKGMSSQTPTPAASFVVPRLLPANAGMVHEDEHREDVEQGPQWVLENLEFQGLSDNETRLACACTH